MSWSGGSELMSEVIHALDKLAINESKRRKLYERLIPAFEREDWEGIQDCLGEDPAYDAAVEKLRPEWFEEE